MTTHQGERGRVVLPGDARVIEVGGFDVVVLADGGDTGERFALIETREEEAGMGPPLHIHRDAAESFYVLEGVYRMHLDGRDFMCPAGSFVYVPVGLVHTFSSITAASRKLNLYTPAGMVGYFDDLAAAIQADAGETDLDAIADRYRMEVVGPIPEGYV